MTSMTTDRYSNRRPPPVPARPRDYPLRTSGHPRALAAKTRLAACLAALLAIPASGRIAPAQFTDDEAVARLKAQLDAILMPQGQPVRVGASVVDLESGREIYQLQGNTLLIPASNMKLVVMAAAVDRLGHDYTFATVLAIHDTHLVVVGGGDPTIGDELLCRRRGLSITHLFHEWAAALKQAGIKQIPGDILIDDSIFDTRFVHPNWPENQYQAWYEAPVGGLSINENCVQALVSPTEPGKPARVTLVPGNTYITVDNKAVTGAKSSVTVTRPRDADTLNVRGTVAAQGLLEKVTVRDPGLFFGSVLKTVLATDGIPVGGQVVRKRVRLENGLLPNDCHLVHVHRTPLADALSRCGKDSRGLMAESLLKTLGARQYGQGSWDNGRSAVHLFLRDVNVPASEIKIDDGSGLSRYNRLSPSASTRILRHMFASTPERFELFRESLAVAGVDGTLMKRLRTPETKGRLFAKTGYINNVWTLAGYVRTSSDQWLAFAIYVNGTSKQTPSQKARIDRACRILAQWPNIAAPPPSTRPTSTAQSHEEGRAR